MSVQVAALNTEMDLVLWIGATVGALLVAQLLGFFKFTREDRNPYGIFDKYYNMLRLPPQMTQSETAHLQQLLEWYLTQREREGEEGSLKQRKKPETPNLPSS